MEEFGRSICNIQDPNSLIFGCAYVGNVVRRQVVMYVDADLADAVRCGKSVCFRVAGFDRKRGGKCIVDDEWNVLYCVCIIFDVDGSDGVADDEVGNADVRAVC